MQHRDTYLKTRLGIDATDPVCQRESQILHYRTKRPRAQAWWTFTGYVSDYSAILAPPFVLISLLNKLMHWGLESHPGGWFLVSFLPIALPLIAGVANGIRHALDAGRRKERYPEMEQRLTALRTHLTLCSTPATISNAVTETEEILLDELREWQLTARNTGH